MEGQQLNCIETQAKLNYLLCGFMGPLYKPSHIEWISSSLRDKKEQILERQKKFTGSEKNGGKIMGINQFLDTEFLLPHTPSINIVCNSPCAPLH